MSMKKPKKRLADLEGWSKENADKRVAVLRNLGALPIGATAEDIQRVVQEYPPLMAEIIVAGARALVSSLRLSAARQPSLVNLEERRAVRESTAKSIAAVGRQIVRTVEIGSKAVALLDSYLINGKMLGDFTKRELEVEINSERRRGEVIFDRIEWLEAIAKLVGPNQTVRTVARSAIIPLLERKP